MQRSWVGTVVGSPAKGRSAGVLILIRKSLPHTILAHRCDPSEGQWSNVSLQVGAKTVDIWNVYGPNTDNILASSDPSALIIGGDFNAVPSPLEDRSGTPLRHSTSSTSHDDQLASLIDSSVLVDAWGFLFPLERDYTHFSHAHGVFSRIDLFLVSTSLLSKLCWVTIENMVVSDHCCYPCLSRRFRVRPLHGVSHLSWLTMICLCKIFICGGWNICQVSMSPTLDCTIWLAFSDMPEIG